MKKTLFIALTLCALPLFAMAQAKIGHVNTSDIMQVMPERAVIEKTLNDLQTEWENTLLKSREEYQAKIKEYQEKESTMSQTIKEAKQSELADLEQRMNTLYQTAQSDLQKKQSELTQPVVEKLRKAIEEVGAENGYTYVIDQGTQVLLYIAPTASDITPQVKTKLGIK